MKKLFVSTPMTGLKEEDILKRMQELKKEAEDLVGEEFELIDTYHKTDVPEGSGICGILATRSSLWIRLT